VITCPPPATAIVDPGTCEVTGMDIGSATATDNCSATGEIVFTNNAPAAFPGGVTIVTWTATDACGNFSTCEQTVTVEDDIPPTIICPPDVFVTAPAPACTLEVKNIQYPEIDDNCDISLLTLSWEKSEATTGTGTGDVNNTLFNVGVTTVIYTVTDSWHNTATCEFKVTVNDEVPPKIIDCHNETVNVNNDPGECTARVDIETPEAFDPCGETYTITNDFNGTSNASDEYPVGTTVVTWTIIDASGNEVTCQITVIVTDIETPDIVCPKNIEGLITGNGCVLENFPVPDPVITENCLYTVSWVMTGATIGNGTGFVGGEDFNVGITYVSYTVTDASGKTDNCNFQVWIKNLDVPQFVATCPIETVTATTDPDRCDALVDVTPPTISNPCGELYSISHDSPYSSDPNDASGIYPVGSTPFTWTIIDASGNIKTCPQTVTVTDDQYPTIVCPGDQEYNADFDQNYSSIVVPGIPTYSDNCGIASLTWVSSAPTPSSGTGVNTTTVFYVGVTTITYTATDVNGNVSTCSFTITVLSEPVIECPLAIEESTDPGVCSATLDPGGPTKISGVEPITWTYTIKDQAGNILATNTCTTATLATCIGDFTFPVGTNTITWTAKNVSGTVDCIQTIIVTDKEAPTFTAPVNPSFCVINIISAVYDGQPEPAADIVPDPLFAPPYPTDWHRPDWYVLNGTNKLDITNIIDNCPCPAGQEMQISWIIEFAGNEPGQDDITGTGQPSDHPDPIILWGTTDYSEVTHKITYTVADCNGNVSDPVTIDILIKPRPEVIKMPPP